MSRFAAFASSILLACLIPAGAARADDTAAALTTLLGSRIERVLDGSVFTFSSALSQQERPSIVGMIVTSSPERCVFEATAAVQSPFADRAPMVMQYRYDLRRLAAIEFLKPQQGEGVPHATVVPRDSPDAHGVRLRGPALACSRAFDLAHQRPRFRSECEDALETWGLGDSEERQRIEAALATLTAACPVR